MSDKNEQLPLSKSIPLGIQHVLAFVLNAILPKE